jgi:hypothetical protein
MHVNDFEVLYVCNRLFARFQMRCLISSIENVMRQVSNSPTMQCSCLQLAFVFTSTYPYNVFGVSDIMR